MASLPQDLALEVRRTLKSPRPRQVHDLRVAIRRFNQALALNSPNRNKGPRRRTKKIMKRAGDVRNLDIALKLVSKVRGPAALSSKLHRRREAAAKRLASELKAAIDHGLPDPPPAKRTNSRLAAVRAIRRLFKRGSKAREPKDLHRVRIAAKKLRYTLEMVAPDHPRLDDLKRLQTDLGDINDYETARAIILQETGAKSVCDRLKEKQDRKVREFRKQWTGILTDPSAPQKWIRELS